MMGKKKDILKVPETVNEDKPQISFFSSLAEQEAAHYQWLSSLTPEQHLKNALANIIRIYGEEVCQRPMQSKEIRFE